MFRIGQPHGSLPVELFVRILVSLNLVDIVRCRAVSKQFRLIVDTVPEMQYKIELDVSGCIDNPQHPCDVTERLRLLREAQESWKTPRLSRNSSKPIYSFPSTALFFGKYHGNVFVHPLRFQTESDGRKQCWGMECVSVGHSGGAAISQTWKLSFDFPFSSYAVDPCRNLVALLTTIDTAKGAILRMCSLSDGSLLEEIVLNLQLDSLVRSFSATETLQICGRFVAIGATIVDWTKPGIRVLAKQMEETCGDYQDVPFAFLSDSCFLLGSEKETYCAIEVFSMKPDIAAEDLDGTISPIHVASYIFPPYHPIASKTPKKLSFGTRLYSSLYGPASPSPFGIAPSSVMLVVKRNCSWAFGEVEWFIPSAVFLAAPGIYQSKVATEPLVFPWDAWGPSSTRCFKVETVRAVRNIKAGYGSRILKTIVRDRTAVECLMDFNQFSIARELYAQRRASDLPSHNLNAAPDSTYRIAREPTVVERGDIFLHDIVTSLPYRCIETPRVRQTSFDVYGGDPWVGQFITGSKDDGFPSFQYCVLDI